MGLCNAFWWVDRSKGVAGMLAAQVSVTFSIVEVLLEYLFVDWR
jgi:hypothetical protein